MTAELRIAIRQFAPGDEGVVIGPWMAQLRDLPESEPARGIFRRLTDDCWSAQRALVGNLVSDCPPLMAVHPEHPDQVYGWVCAELAGNLQVLHQVYVRNMWRQKGVASRLLRQIFGAGLGIQFLFYTHPGKATQHHARRWALRFNPYLVRH